MELYHHSPIRLHGVVFNFIIKYRGNIVFFYFKISMKGDSIKRPKGRNYTNKYGGKCLSLYTETREEETRFQADSSECNVYIYTGRQRHIISRRWLPSNALCCTNARSRGALCCGGAGQARACAGEASEVGGLRVRGARLGNSNIGVVQTCFIIRQYQGSRPK
jgi:hypothetical protein